MFSNKDTRIAKSIFGVSFAIDKDSQYKIGQNYYKTIEEESKTRYKRYLSTAETNQ